MTPPHDHHALHLMLARYPIIGYCGAADPRHIIDITPAEATRAAVFAHH